MPTVVGSQLNKAVSAVLTPAELAAGFGFVAVNLDATYGSGYLVEGIDFTVTFFTPADFGNMNRVSANIDRNVQINANTTIASQVTQAEVLWSASGAVLLQRAISRLFIPAFQLAAGGQYAIIGDFGINPGPAGNIALTLSVTGRPMQGNAPPIQLR